MNAEKTKIELPVEPGTPVYCVSICTCGHQYKEQCRVLAGKSISAKCSCVMEIDPTASKPRESRCVKVFIKPFDPMKHLSGWGKKVFASLDDVKVYYGKAEAKLSRLDAIKIYAAKKEAEAKGVALAYRSEHARLVHAVKELHPRMNALIETAQACLDAGIEINAYKNKRYSSHDDYWEKGTFVSNGLSHRIGFILKQDEWGTLLGVSDMGIIAGGACGFVDFRAGCRPSEVCPYGAWYDDKARKPVNEAPPTKLMKRFVEGFDEFETAFYAYVDNIVKEK
ncbi:MAG: hypothetical protein J6L88_02475 [Clostridia bacterium]|nr:hypothetical protein [Clostridia bacterium]